MKNCVRPVREHRPNKHVDEQDRHQKVLQKGGIACAYSYSKLPDEGIFNGYGGREAKKTPANEVARRKIGRKVPSSEPEVGVKDPDITREPNGINDRLHADAGLKPENRVQQFPGDVQAQRVKRDRVRPVSEAHANALDINDCPTSAANDSEDKFDRFELSHFEIVSLDPISICLMPCATTIPNSQDTPGTRSPASSAAGSAAPACDEASPAAHGAAGSPGYYFPVTRFTCVGSGSLSEVGLVTDLAGLIGRRRREALAGG